MQVARDALSSKGTTTTTEDMMVEEIDPGGGGVRSTSLAKREC